MSARRPNVVRVAHSPDADDLFMMRALQLDLIPTGPWRFELRTAPTDALNRLASTDEVDVLALSIAHWPHIADRWQLLPHGGSLGEGYGPVVVAREPTSLDALRGRRVAIPGTTTTAWAVLRQLVDVEPVEIPIVPYARVFEALRAGEVDAALVIHEGRLTYAAEGFVALTDIGEAWAARTGGLPLPLGANAIRRDLGPEAIAEISALLRASIAHALEHRDEAIAWLLDQGGALRTAEALDRYLAMYANARTLDYGPEGRAGVEALIAGGAQVGLWPARTVDWAP